MTVVFLSAGDTTLSNERDRCTPPSELADDYRMEMQHKIDDAEAATREAHEITIRVSRQTYRDLVEAYRFLRQINPWYKSIGKRLETLSLQVRDQLDRKGVPAMLPIGFLLSPVYSAYSMGVSPRRLLQFALAAITTFIGMS